MNTPNGNQTFNADTTRTAVLNTRPPRRRTTSLLNLLAEMDEAAVMQNFDGEVRHAEDGDFAPMIELTNTEKVELIISDPPKPKGIEALLVELDKAATAESNPDYASYEITA